MNQDADFEVLLELTAQLQLQDIEEWRASQKGKGRVGVLSEVEMTLNAIEDEHKATLRSIADRRITRSAERAVSEDLDLIEALAAIEEQEQEDRRLALMLSENPNTQIPLSSTSVSTNTSRFRSPYGLSENPSMDSLESYPGSVTSRLGRLSLGSSRTSVG
ncbi:hypothetical protein FRC09_016647 [Ceratobasidium sp. 395]|nr:hypothetical protein FRC09_016647 [Ceratobasidium sp. 395]